MKKEKDVLENLAEKAYDDVGKPALTELGGFFGAIAGFFNNVVAAPLHRLNAKYKLKTQMYIYNLYEKYQMIPDENKQEPPLQIVGPTIEALKFNLDDDDLSCLFTNLLLSSMDNRIAHKCHPAYVQIISQMDGADARVLATIFARKGGRIPMVMPKCSIKLEYQGRILDGYSMHPEKFPELYIGFVESLSMFDISKSLYNLSRLGVIEINKQFAMRSDFVDVYKPLMESKEIQELFDKEELIKIPSAHLTFDKGSIEFTEFGRDFAETVIKE